MKKQQIGIRDFYVEVQSVKGGTGGFVDMCNYLDNTEHPNHKGKTETIRSVIGKNFKDNMIDRFYDRLKRDDIEKRKGRPVSSLRTSWCFSIPSSQNPTEEQLNKMIQDIGNRFMSILKISEQEFKDMAKINIHYNDNVHINVMVSRLLPNLESFDLSKPYYVNSMKKCFNLTIFKNLGIDKKSYKPENKQKQNKNRVLYNEVKEIKKELKQDFDNKVKELKQEHQEQIKEIKYIHKIEKRIDTYLNRFDNQTTPNKKIKEENLILKSFEKLLELPNYEYNEYNNKIIKRKINTDSIRDKFRNVQSLEQFDTPKNEVSKGVSNDFK